MKHAEEALSQVKARASVAFDFGGHWLNELGSYMDLAVADGIVSGTYVSTAGSGGPISKPVYGTVTDDLISFTVNWGPAITAWVGHGVLVKGLPQILTLWHMVVAIADETDPAEQWKTVMAGADQFTR